MRTSLHLLCALLPCALTAACDSSSSNADGGGDASTPPDLSVDAQPAPFGLDSRPANPSCVAPARPMNTSGGIALQRVFSSLTFSLPIKMVQAPADPSRWFLVQKTGQVIVFPNADTTTTSATFIDISTEVNATQNESGLLGMAFHPQFATNKQFFLSYSAHSASSPVDLRNTISRFTLKADGTGDPASEQKVLPPTDGLTAKLGGNPAGAAANPLDKEFGNHNGGNIDFGPDGFLYFGMGDGGSGGDPYGNGQNTNVFFGKLLRVDVDNVPAGARYGIPTDNPFKNGGGAPEIFAYGLRNPWRWSFDRTTGDLWVGDVGQNLYEEVDKVLLGGNYGWNLCEGFHTYPGNTLPCNPPGTTPPLVEYNHPGGASRAITGGYVYRGTAIPQLVGTYLYADEVSGDLWELTYDATGAASGTMLLNAGFNPSSFSEGLDGELYLMDYGNGRVYKIVPSGSTTPPNFPQKLSQTGCTAPGDVTQPAAGLIPYGVNVALWSDGASKQRWMAIPDGKQIHVEADGDFTLPIGTVLMKTFAIGGVPVETRLLMHHPDDVWAGYSYEWDADGKDATLLPAGKTKAVGGQSWTYPSRSDCLACHTTAAGRSLGLEVLQQNGNFTYASTARISNQLATLDHIGMFDAPIGDPATLGKLPALTGTDPVDTRARGYLHANCSFCHRPMSTGQGPSDWRFQTTFKATGTCGAMPQEGTLGVTGALVIAPGMPMKSLVSLRMHALDVNRMPPLASHVVDATGTMVVDQWIQSLTTCP
jgi:uncharacterized repeat protein (TIGR03806 family)